MFSQPCKYTRCSQFRTACGGAAAVLSFAAGGGSSILFLLHSRSLSDLAGHMSRRQAIKDIEHDNSQLRLEVSILPDELTLRGTLEIGQCFHWKPLFCEETHNGANSRRMGMGEVCRLGAPLGVNDGVVLMKQNPGEPVSAWLLGGANARMSEARVNSYFNAPPLGPSLKALHADWARTAGRASAELASAACALPGLRVVRQDATEALFSFICSSNNNVARITLINDRLRAQFGNRLCSLPDELVPSSGGPSHFDELRERRAIYSFPTAEVLAGSSEKELKSLGLGYRAKYVLGSARALCALAGSRSTAASILQELGNSPRQQAEMELRRLPGVGPKVAACVALHGLGHADSVPVDVHVARAVARRGLLSEALAARLQKKALTHKLHDEVGDCLRDLYGSHAGWAQTLLFGAERMHSKLDPALEIDEQLK
eukprot:TRINITY_DN107476_c0_g1_i1.p1 TRINITY_DN107476_c0_g1~~TRINITY_DN107476_c0_g1_i1.p1  ORF type:complete len:430 (+),score=56.51 TRINITY_DN107476_c0_g1_i1:202-1491(+)